MTSMYDAQQMSGRWSITNPPMYFEGKRKNMASPDYYISVKFNDREPEQGDRVDVTLPGTVVNYNSDNGDIWVDLDSYHLEHVGRSSLTDKNAALVFTDIKHVVPGVPEMAAGQVYRKNGRTYLVYREKPLSQGGDLVIRDSLTGMLVGAGNIIGAELVYDPEKEN